MIVQTTLRTLVRTLGISLLFASALTLAGCGKKGALSAPEGEESNYTYPQPYPKPQSVIPADSTSLSGSDQEEPGKGDPLRRTTKTYGSSE